MTDSASNPDEARPHVDRPVSGDGAVNRRGFIGTALAAGIGIAAGAHDAFGAVPSVAPSTAAPTFKLKYAPHFGQFTQHAGNDLVAQLEFARSEGFTAWEDNGMRDRSIADQERIASAMTRLGIEMGVIIGHKIDWSTPSLATGDVAIRDKFLEEVRESAEVVKRVNGKSMVVVPGVADRRIDPEFQMATVIDTLRRALDILTPLGVGLLLETLNTRRDHPGQLLARVSQLFLATRAINSPLCKIQFDIYHVQINEGNIIPLIDSAWSEIGYVQVGDNPGRKEPGTGEINYRNVFKHLASKGYSGVVGMEHGSSKPGKEGERAVIDAYIAADSF